MAVASDFVQVDLADVNFILMHFVWEFNDEQFFAFLGKSQLQLDPKLISFKVMDDWQKFLLFFSQHLQILYKKAHLILTYLND